MSGIDAELGIQFQTCSHCWQRFLYLLAKILVSINLDTGLKFDHLKNTLTAVQKVLARSPNVSKNSDGLFKKCSY